MRQREGRKWRELRESKKGDEGREVEQGKREQEDGKGEGKGRRGVMVNTLEGYKIPATSREPSIMNNIFFFTTVIRFCAKDHQIDLENK